MYGVIFITVFKFRAYLIEAIWLEDVKPEHLVHLNLTVGQRPFANLKL